MLPDYLNSNKEIKGLMSWLSLEHANTPFNAQFHIETRDIFQAKLDSLYVTVKDSLVIAVLGEIGNNSFDHNLGKWQDIQGIYFQPPDPSSKIMILADRGQGVRTTISRVVPGVANDLEAIKIAFTQIISGRSPEQRGNGLKFVASVVEQNDWELFFQSGNGCALINEQGLAFFSSDQEVKGCFATLKTKEGKP